jgi:hypothetical protein
MELISIISYIILPSTFTLAIIIGVFGPRREGTSEVLISFLFCNLIGYINICAGNLHWALLLFINIIEVIIILFLTTRPFERANDLALITP